jgi:hypothetical protein
MHKRRCGAAAALRCCWQTDRTPRPRPRHGPPFWYDSIESRRCFASFWMVAITSLSPSAAPVARSSISRCFRLALRKRMASSLAGCACVRACVRACVCVWEGGVEQAGARGCELSADQKRGGRPSTCVLHAASAGACVPDSGRT